MHYAWGIYMCTHNTPHAIQAALNNALTACLFEEARETVMRANNTHPNLWMPSLASVTAAAAAAAA